MFQVHIMNSLSSWPSRCLSYDLCTPCLSGIPWPLGIALCYFPVTICPFKVCGPEAKFSQVSHLEITAFFILIIAISFSSSLYNLFLMKILLQFPLEHFFSLSLQEPLFPVVQLYYVFICFPQEYCSPSLGFITFSFRWH